MAVPSRSPSKLALALAAVTVAATACGGDPGTGEDSGTEETDSTDDSGESGDGTDTSDSEDTGTTDNEILEIELIKHPDQPMVVDIIVRLAQPGTAAIEHLDDAGVAVSQTSDPMPAQEHTFRLRGLAPETEHSVAVTIPDGEDLDYDFSTDPPLPGFLPAFAVESSNETPESVYRLFDVGRFNVGQIAGIYQVDTEGRTRWYTGAPNSIGGPGGVWSGVKLLADGRLMFLRNDALVIIDELDSVETPQLEISAEDLGVSVLHHEILELPNGNFLSLSATLQDIDYPGEGVVPTVGDLIVEFDDQGETVWTWDAFDHLDPQRIRGGFEPEANPPVHDWTHANGLEYWEDQDLIILTMRHQDWVIGIDHESGDVEWRLGEEGDFTLDTGEWFFHPHSPQRQPDETVILYDNGFNNPHLPAPQWRSRAVQYALDYDLMTADQIWEDEEQDELAPAMGDVDRMPGGNLLVLDSSIDLQMGGDVVYARMRELDPQADPQRVWALQTPPGYFAYRGLPTARLIGMAE